MLDRFDRNVQVYIVETDNLAVLTPFIKYSIDGLTSPSIHQMYQHNELAIYLGNYCIFSIRIEGEGFQQYFGRLVTSNPHEDIKNLDRNLIFHRFDDFQYLFSSVNINITQLSNLHQLIASELSKVDVQIKNQAVTVFSESVPKTEEEIVPVEIWTPIVPTETTTDQFLRLDHVLRQKKMNFFTS